MNMLWYIFIYQAIYFDKSLARIGRICDILYRKDDFNTLLVGNTAWVPSDRHFCLHITSQITFWHHHVTWQHNLIYRKKLKIISDRQLSRSEYFIYNTHCLWNCIVCVRWKTVLYRIQTICRMVHYWCF